MMQIADEEFMGSNSDDSCFFRNASSIESVYLLSYHACVNNIPVAVGSNRMDRSNK